MKKRKKIECDRSYIINYVNYLLFLFFKLEVEFFFEIDKHKY